MEILDNLNYYFYFIFIYPHNSTKGKIDIPVTDFYPQFMKISSQIKLTHDAYAGFYSAGLTMLNSKTMERFTMTRHTNNETVYTSSDDLTLMVQHEKDSQTGAIRVQTIFTNNSKENITLEMVDSFVISEVEGDKIHRFLSFWSAEGRHKVDNVIDLNLEPSWTHTAYRVEKFGNVGSMPIRKYFPFVAIEDSKTGNFTAVQLYSPASWQMEVIIQEDERVTLTGGIADRDFGQFTKTLKPGEIFITPKAYVATGNSLVDVCDKLVKSQHPDISPVDDHMGITFNEYCTSWGNPSEESMKKIADCIEGKGIDYLVIDAGWFIQGKGKWWDETGNWNYSQKLFPNGLKPVADYIKSKGMIPGIWYEFENVSPMCELFEKDEYLVKKDSRPLTVGDRRFLDMQKDIVKDHLNKMVIDNLKDAGFGYIKVDYNDTMGMGCDGPDGMGENLRQKVLATQDFFRKMKAQIPELVIENCSSGGHRLEPSFMELASMASFSDAHEITALPLIAAALQLLIKPEQSQIWAVLRKDDSPARLYYSLCATLFGRMGLSGDIYDISKDQWAILEEGIAFYKKAADIIKNGKTTLIHSTSKSNNNPSGGQLSIREYEGKCLVIYHRFENSKDVYDFIEDEEISLNLKEEKIFSSFGCADQDFSAKAFILDLN